MDVQTISFDRDKARELYRAYKKHQHYSTPMDDEIRRTYQLIAQGRIVIKALDSIKQAGLDEEGLPKLAIARATAEKCYLRIHQDGRATFADVPDAAWTAVRKKIDFPRESFFVPPFPKERYYTPSWLDKESILPTIPIHLRPKRGLNNYHILWEAEWHPTPPVDPMLIRRIGKADLWLVVAAWDLTEVEQAVLAGRMNG